MNAIASIACWRASEDSATEVARASKASSAARGCNLHAKPLIAADHLIGSPSPNFFSSSG